MEAVKEEVKRSVVVPEQRMNSAEYWRRDWVVNAEEGTTKDDILKPDYWALVSYKMHPYDRIELRLETGEWIAELLVVQAERTFAKVVLLHFHELVSANSLPEVPSKFRIEWKGPQHKHAVIRVSDSVVLKNGFDSKDKARDWLTNYERAAAT